MQQYWIQVLATKCEGENIPTVLNELEKTLEGSKHIVGELSLADFHWAATFKALEEVGNTPDLSNYKNISNWYAHMKNEIPSFDVSGEKVAA